MANAHSPVPPKVKLTYHQRQRLISQGRCFTCRQKGHRSQDCKRSLNSPLAKLPVEILEAICTNLVYPCGKMFDVPFIWFMYDLRLACREINAKTLSFFHREGFRTMLVKSTYKGFQKLSEISNYPPFASKIERLSFSTIDEEMMEPEEYAQLQAQLLNTSLNLQQRQEIAMRIHDIDLMQTDKAFMDTSAAGGIMLNMALRNMANLQDIRIHCLTNEEWPGQQGMPSNELTISRRFSMILSSLAFSGTKLRVLQVVGFGYGSAAHGVSIQALCVPSEFLPCLSELRSLYLPLETTDLFLPNTTASILAASIFLKHTPLLTTLWLSFLDQHWNDTKKIFMEIADIVILSNLKTLTIDGLRCIGRDMELFLQNHNSLEHLVFNNMDIEPPGTLADILDKASCLKHLTKFRCSQIAQDGFRVKFSTLCYVEVSDHGWSSSDEDTLWVNQFKYIGVAEEWENVSSKLHDLSRDVAVTTREIHTDWEGGYNWRD